MASNGLDVLLGAQPQQATSGLDVLMGAQVPAAPAAPQGDASQGGKLAGFKQGVYDSANGPAQLLFRALPEGARSALTKADNWLYDKTGGAVGIKPGENIDTAVRAQNEAYEANRKAAGREGVDWMRIGGNTVGSLPLVAATGGAAAPQSFTGAVGMGALGGAAAGAATPVTSGEDYWREKRNQMVTGGATGGAGAAATRFVSGLLAPVVGKDQQTLIDAGVNLTPGQIKGGTWKRVEDAATSVPVLGDMVKNAQRRSFQDLNDSAINRSLEPIGVKLPSSVKGRDAIAFADKAIGDAYDTALTKIGAVRPDQQFAGDLSNVLSMVQNVPKDKAQQFTNIVKNEIGSRLNNGSMTSEGFKAADSNIGQIARGYLRSNDYDTQTMGQALMEVQRSMRQMLERVAPKDQSEALKAANKSFAMFLRPQKASSYVGAEGGVFTPEQLQSAVRALDASKRKTAFSQGDALMQDLSEAGKNVMGNKVPDSGTPFRHAVQAGVAGVLGHSMLPEGAAAYAIPAAAGAGVAALPYTQWGQAAAQALLAGERPQNIKLLGELLRRSAPATGAVAVPYALSNGQ